VRKITPGALVTVVAGKGTEGFANGRADTAMFGEEASGIVAGPDGSIYVSDFNNKRIRKISATGIVTTFAGSGQTGFINGNPDVAEFFSPAGIVMDRQGNLLITDFNRIRHVTPAGFVSLLTGKDSSGYRDGPLAVALFSEVNDIVIDAQENMYVADGNRIRKITPQGIVSTIAGSTGGFQDGEGSVAKFNDIVGLGIDRQGNIYAADVNNHRIRKISFE
jgi:sugar lactone lactonase YvrE